MRHTAFLIIFVTNLFCLDIFGVQEVDGVEHVRLYQLVYDDGVIFAPDASRTAKAYLFFDSNLQGVRDILEKYIYWCTLATNTIDSVDKLIGEVAPELCVFRYHTEIRTSYVSRMQFYFELKSRSPDDAPIMLLRINMPSVTARDNAYMKVRGHQITLNYSNACKMYSYFKEGFLLDKERSKKASEIFQ